MFTQDESLAKIIAGMAIFCHFREIICALNGFYAQFASIDVCEINISVWFVKINVFKKLLLGDSRKLMYTKNSQVGP